MSQEQPRRPRDNENQPQDLEREPITFGDVFPVTGGLADKPVAPQDAAMMQTAEATAFGETQTGDPADLMASAAAINERAGLVDRSDVTDMARDRGVTITGTEVPGACLVTETFAGQVVGQHVQVAVPTTDQTQAQANLAIGQAMEATMKAAGDKPVEYSDAAAIAESEMRATGQTFVMQGGHAASAQSAAEYNTGIISDRDKIKLRDVVVGASTNLPAKEVTRDDAEAVASVEQRNSPNLTTRPGGIGSSMDTAARLNENTASATP